MYVITYDVGTTGLKSCLFDIEKGKQVRMIAGEDVGYGLQIFPDGGAEQDPMDWWRAMCVTTSKLLIKAGVTSDQIKGISFCAQMQALVLVDEQGEPVRPAMSYMDARGKKQIEETLQTGFQIAGMNAMKLWKSLKITGAVSGSVKDPVWKYRWVRDNEPEVFAKAYKWLDAKDFLVCRATGRFTMSQDSAFGTLLYDTREGRRGFSEEMCRMMDVDMKHLPEIVSSDDAVGGITERAAIELGLKAGTLVFSGGGDASLIGVGAGAVSIGQTHVYMGTSGWISTVIGQQKLDVSSMVASVVGVNPKVFHCWAELETAGKCLDWFRKNVMADIGKSPDFYERMERNMIKVPAGSNGVMFTPWLHGNRCPFEDPHARGMFIGMGLDTTATEMYNAIAEGICLHIRWQMEAMDKLIPSSDPIRFAGGCALQPSICQILADVLGKRVEVVSNPINAGSAGAAIIAAMGLGEIQTFEETKDMIGVERTYYPNTANKAVYDDLEERLRILYKTNKKNFRALGR